MPADFSMTGCFALTERTMVLTSRGLETTARFENGTWILNGKNAGLVMPHYLSTSQWLQRRSRWPGEDFLARTDDPGVHLSKIEGKTSRMVNNANIDLTDVRAPRVIGCNG